MTTRTSRRATSVRATSWPPTARSGAARRRPRAHGRVRAARWLGAALMIVSGLFTAVPLVLLLVNALKTNEEIVSAPLALPGSPHWGNIADAWSGGTFGDPLSSSFLNSVIITLAATVGATALAALAGYAIANVPRRAERWVTTGVLLLLALPVQAMLIPIFDMLGGWGLRNTYLGIVLVYCAFWMPFSVLLLRAAFQAFPRELLEAARIDGAGELRTFFSVVLPVVKGPVAGVAVVNAIGIWSELLFSFVLLTQPSLRTLPSAVIAFQGVYTTDYRLLYAGLLISVLPVLVFYGGLSGFIRKGMSAGSFR